MNIPNSLASNLRNLFQALYYSSNTISSYSGEIDGNQICTIGYTNIHGEIKDRIIVPLYIYRSCAKHVFSDQTTIVYKWLLDNSYVSTLKSGNSLINNMIRYANGIKLECFKTNTGVTYYGGRSAILKMHRDRLIPLMIPAVEAVINEDHKLYIEKGLLLVDKRVFTDGDPISNFIMKKAIPFLSDVRWQADSQNCTIEPRIIDLSFSMRKTDFPSEVVTKESLYNSLNPV